MDLSQISSDMTANAVELAYAVQGIKAQQQTMQIAGNLIEDVAEISAEAMSRYTAEANQ